MASEPKLYLRLLQAPFQAGQACNSSVSLKYYENSITKFRVPPPAEGRLQRPNQRLLAPVNKARREGNLTEFNSTARLALVDQHGQGENSCQSHPSAKISCTYFDKVNGKSVVATVNMVIGRPAPVQNAQSPSFGNRARKAEAGVASAGPTTHRNHPHSLFSLVHFE